MHNVIDQIGELLSQLQSEDFFVREKAVTQLGTFERDEAVAGLIMAIEDPDPGIRELASEHLVRVQGDTAAQLLIEFLGHDDIGVRNLAAEIIVKFGSKAVPHLIAGIDVDDYDVRKFIVDILGLIKDKHSTEALCQKLYDENINVVCSAAEALGEVGSTDTIPALAAAFDKIEDIRLNVVEALGKIGTEQALEHLLGYLKSDDSMIQTVSIEAIGNTGLLSAVPELQKILSQEDRSLAETALAAIIAICNANDGKIDCDLPLDSFKDFLFEGMRNKDEGITRFMLAQLKHWFGTDIVSGLLDVLDTVEGDDLKQLVDILGSVGGSLTALVLEKFPSKSATSKQIYLDIIKPHVDEAIIDNLIEFADDDDSEVRQKIAHLIGISGCNRAIPTLEKMTKDEVGHVRSAAYGGLGWLLTEDRIELIRSGLNDSYPDVRQAAAGALVVIGGSTVAALFRDALFEGEVEQQQLAAQALGMIGDDHVVEPLLEALNHPDSTIRKSAVSSLARIDSGSVYQPMAVALNDECPAVRKAVVSALIYLGGNSAVKDVRFLLEDDDVWVKYHTISAIGGLGNPEHSDLILPYLENEQDIIKIAATKALANMKCLRATSTLHELCKGDNEDIVTAAREAISDLEGTK